MENCIFCKIAKGDVQSVVIWEDKKYFAFLDVNPNTKGMTLVIPKKHYQSDVFKLSDQEMLNFLQATKKVANILEKGLRVQRVALIIEGMGVNHLHSKLYPLYGLNNTFSENMTNKRIYFDKYEGYLSTQLGPSLSINKLRRIAAEMRETH